MSQIKLFIEHNLLLAIRKLPILSITPDDRYYRSYLGLTRNRLLGRSYQPRSIRLPLFHLVSSPKPITAFPGNCMSNVTKTCIITPASRVTDL